MKMSGCVLSLAVVLLGACQGSSEPCGAATLNSAVVAIITDSITGAPLAYRSSLIIRDGAYVDSVPFNSTVVDSARVSTLLAGLDREGTYAVTVRREGSRVWTRDNVRASRDRCGELKEARLQVRLQPAL
jgi:hypothetical protein